MDGHSGAPVRSRTSQTPSPSHSASASASASSSVHHKRKFHATATPFSAPDAGALTSNDDLDSVSAREDDEEDDTDDDDDEEEEVDEDDEERRGPRFYAHLPLPPVSMAVPHLEEVGAIAREVRSRRSQSLQ
ncbi:hypothetical protein DsansV1_C12g0114381 [Dioscorea sansibarensis]